MTTAKNRIVKILESKGPVKLHKIKPYERSHFTHSTFYKFMRTDIMWTLKYLQDLIKDGIVSIDENNKYFLV